MKIMFSKVQFLGIGGCALACVCGGASSPSDKGRLVYAVKGWNTPEVGK